MTDDASVVDPYQRPRARATFWLILAVGGALMAAMWLGTIELANLQADDQLQRLNAEPDPDWHVVQYTRRDIQNQIAVDEAGEPLPEPLDDNWQDQIDDVWLPYAKRRHLFYMLIGFGSLLYPLAITAQASGVMLWRARPGTGWRTLAAGCVLVGTVVIVRGASLGVLRHGVLQLL